MDKLKDMALDGSDLKLRKQEDRIQNDPDKVLALQERLHVLGWLHKDQITGVFDDNTDKAVRGFQAKHNDKIRLIDGIAGDETIDLVNKYVFAHYQKSMAKAVAEANKAIKSFPHIVPAVPATQPSENKRPPAIKPAIEDIDVSNVQKIAPAPQPKAADAAKKVTAAASTDHKTVTITRTDGSVETRQGGSLAWRNYNPSNIRSSGKPDCFAMRHGAIGVNNGFAIFPDEKTGRDADKALLFTKAYLDGDMTVNAVIAKRSPPSDNNDTAGMQKEICAACGIDGSATKIKDLKPDELDKLLNAINKREGWIAGTDTIIAAPLVAPDKSTGQQKVSRAAAAKS